MMTAQPDHATSMPNRITDKPTRAADKPNLAMDASVCGAESPSAEADTRRCDIDSPNEATTAHYYIGIMSGTSTDAVDASLVRIQALGSSTVTQASFAPQSSSGSQASSEPQSSAALQTSSASASHGGIVTPPMQPIQLVAMHSLPIPNTLREAILALNHRGDNELHRAAEVSQALGRLYAQVTLELVAQQGLQASDIRALGIHGQTVRHRPDQGYSIQLNAPALVAELTGIDVIADFRSRDVAAGGQGAPLIPAFHRAVFGQILAQDAMSIDRSSSIALLNIGGMANLSILKADGHTLGFDCGPGNALLDYWCQRHTGQRYDHNGEWAATGQASPQLLQHFIDSEPWFEQVPPKSTGRDQFNPTWLNERLANTLLTPADIQATLVQLTAQLALLDLARYAADCRNLIVFGGGAKNPQLMQALRQSSPCPVVTSDRYGIPSQAMESMAFAWFAWAFKQRLPICTPAMTGARRATVAGALYPA